MTRNGTLAVLLLVVVAGVTGFVFATDAGSDVADAALGEQNPTPYQSEEGSMNDSGGPSAESSSQYRFTIDDIEKCGETCRDVTATLTNVGEEPRSEVVVETRIYAEDDLLWQGNSSAGDISPGESYTTTERVELSYRDGMAIKRNDGYITIQTVVHSEQGREIHQERRKVA
jgi:hypothetical protein